ncbi:hypothetical protein MtrunA17_Chr8g0341961 [Medicago truncatula]|uniref:Transmembrane protein n=1 Tax=Medicago truncatula TaxID=3880 RepID=A0A396GI45_MEDTR|nr:hypothetical protein MtrunA17_Chr8g0341961 [Medicago truncatula]
MVGLPNMCDLNTLPYLQQFATAHHKSLSKTNNLAWLFLFLIKVTLTTILLTNTLSMKLCLLSFIER